ncbi:hypothetical protein F441_10493 [Phytophthora nicotianae CJ01A1]|uniref:Uncharacterized protein n=6 Tax=Phytophthora nicotianae TaxID=4792 RepID=W2R8Z5_PHYN3|nr:hypothetical protein PPTG_21155 [Phytophthora nicotianae INRA-310]ETI44800.1 hypothetical protein F443_10554 [Phytophthora nicotianae P1569]ETK84748.1 hypothetical protein L915_10315 [Phytophthora nicotianae]ETO73410.1 hypothetical protein F444_10653 [Phytophthora nicotianae P1976]ETP14585.1 hypothetical protein F441_10493 [Phytophthora nicotianae CJ01A1]ETP42666.1 hypothetical protein F442_10450 [Phytophthora nicotianae P10297]
MYQYLPKKSQQFGIVGHFSILRLICHHPVVHQLVVGFGRAELESLCQSHSRCHSCRVDAEDNWQRPDYSHQFTSRSQLQQSRLGTRYHHLRNISKAIASAGAE